MTETSLEQESENTPVQQADLATDPRGLYELAYHLVPALNEEGRAVQVDALRKLIEGDGGTIVHETYPEHFELAYTMQRHIAGSIVRFDTSYLGWMNFEADAQFIPGIQDACDRNESIIRVLLVKTERELIAREVRPVAIKGSDAAAIPTKTSEPKTLGKAEGEDDVPKEEMSEEEVDKAIEELVV
jgi:ribosomal protein S6